MDWSGFGAMVPGMMRGGGGLPNGGLLGVAQRAMAPQTPQVPADGAMQPTIGPGMQPGAAPPPGAGGFKFGLPSGGILGLLQGQSPQGIMGMLQRGLPGMSIAGNMPPAGMMPQPGAAPGMPGSPFEGPISPAAAKLPMNINPMDNY